MVEQPGNKTLIPERYRVFSDFLYESGLTMHIGDIYALVLEEGGQHVYRFLANVPDEQQADEIIESLKTKDSPVKLAKGMPVDEQRSLVEGKARGTYWGVGLWQDKGNNPSLIRFLKGTQNG